MARFWDVAVKNLKIVIRDRMYIVMLIIMPITIMLLVGLAFRGEGTIKYAVGYINNDINPLSYASEFIEKLETPLAEWNMTDVLTMKPYNDTLKLKEDFRLGNIKGGLIIHEGFNNPTPLNPTNITLFVDESDISAAANIKARIMIVSQLLFNRQALQPVVNIRPPDEPISVEFSAMNFMVIGTLTYAISVISFSTALSFAKERQSGTFSRMRTTPMSTMDLLTGGLISNIAVSLVQATLVFGTAYGLGFKPMGATDIDKLVNMLAAFAVTVVLAVAFVGIGLVLAAFAKNEDQAVGISWMIIIPMMFISGTWFEPTDPTMSAVAQAFPATYANKAVRAILARGAPLASMYGYIIALIVYAVIAFTLGVLLFRKKTA